MDDKNTKNSGRDAFHLSDKLWDLWCIVSVIGIWPRFIEPGLLVTTKLKLPIPSLPSALKGLRILQFSDLHISPKVPERFLTKLRKRIERLAPDIVVFTGDFLCYSQLDGSDRLRNFLNGIQAPYGCYAIFGNHDYDQSISVNEEGDYDLIDTDSSLISKAFGRFFHPAPLSGKVTEAAKKVSEHRELRYLLNETPFELLNNRTKTLKIRGSYLNICGLGEHMLGKCSPGTAFQGYDPDYPGLVLVHNPDAIPHVKSYPGDIILCGHTHGAQVNLPWLWRKFVLMEHMEYKRGLVKVDNKWAYINRGIGSVMPFRWFSVPEVLLLTLD